MSGWPEITLVILFFLGGFQLHIRTGEPKNKKKEQLKEQPQEALEDNTPDMISDQEGDVSYPRMPAPVKEILAQVLEEYIETQRNSTRRPIGYREVLLSCRHIIRWDTRRCTAFDRYEGQPRIGIQIYCPLCDNPRVPSWYTHSSIVTFHADDFMKDR